MFINLTDASNIHLKSPSFWCNACLTVSVNEPPMRRATLFMEHWLNKSITPLTNEVWRNIPGFNDYYSISNFGRVRSNGKILKGKIYPRLIRSLGITHHGYLSVGLNMNSKSKGLLVHRLVAISFVRNPDNKPFINHIDGDKKNNHYSNLEWCTQSENVIHALKAGLWTPSHALKGRFRGNANRKRRVAKISLDGEVLATYECVKDACDENGITHSAMFNFLKRGNPIPGLQKNLTFCYA